MISSNFIISKRQNVCSQENFKKYIVLSYCYKTCYICSTTEKKCCLKQTVHSGNHVNDQLLNILNKKALKAWTKCLVRAFFNTSSELHTEKTALELILHEVSHSERKPMDTYLVHTNVPNKNHISHFEYFLLTISLSMDPCLRIFISTGNSNLLAAQGVILIHCTMKNTLADLEVQKFLLCHWKNYDQLIFDSGGTIIKNEFFLTAIWLPQDQFWAIIEETASLIRC